MKLPLTYLTNERQRIVFLARRLHRRFNLFPFATSSIEIFHTWLSLVSLLLFTTFILINLKTASLDQQRLSEINKNLRFFEEKMDRFRTLEPEYLTTKKESVLLENALPNNLDTPYLLNKISLLFGKNRLTLLGIKLEKIDLPERKPYFTLLVNLDFQGDYQGISQTLEDVEKDEQQFEMQSLLLRRPYLGKRLEGSLRLKTYFYTPGVAYD